MEVRKITLAAALAMAAIFFMGTASAANIYRWTGSDGTTHYGSSPPPDVEAERIRGASPAPTGSSGDARTQRSDASSGAEPREQESAASGVDDEECAQVRRNLEILEDPSIRRVRTEDGGVEALTGERRQELIDNNREFLEEWC